MFDFFISFILFLIFIGVLFSVIYHLLTNYLHWKYQTIYSTNNPNYSNNLTPGCLPGCTPQGECPNGNFCYNATGKNPSCCAYDFQCNSCKGKRVPPQPTIPTTPPPVTGLNANLNIGTRLPEGMPVIGPRLDAKQLGQVELMRERQRAGDDRFFAQEWAEERGDPTGGALA